MQDYSIASSDHVAMLPYWDMIEAIMGGTATMRAAKEKYLPKFPNETQSDYDFRAKTAKFTNIFRDIVENLSAKPFAKEVVVAVKDNDALPDQAATFIEDVDGRRSHINTFAGQVFFNGLANAVDWILVDYPSDGSKTKVLNDQKKAGIRPYWIRIPAKRLKAAFTAIVDGKEQFIHVRISEDVVEIEGGLEVTKERIRILDRAKTDTGYTPATWQLVEKQTDAKGQTAWVETGSGPITIGVIPLVPFITGRRIDGSWVLWPCLKDAADLQVELFQQESGLKYAKDNTAFPMLAGNGINPPLDDQGKPLPIPVGPKTVLFSPSNSEGDHGEWKYIEPSAESLKFLASEIKETIAQLRELGRQPLTAQTGNLTVVTTAFAADKANSVIQALALNLKDALENAFVYTAMWEKWGFQPTVTIDIDFGIDVGAENGPATLMDARKNGDISRETLYTEFQRRGILSDEFDADQEAERLLTEQPGDSDDELLKAALPSDKPKSTDDDKARKDQETAAVQNAIREMMAGIQDGIKSAA